MDSIFLAGSTVIMVILIKAKYNDIVGLKLQVPNRKSQIANLKLPILYFLAEMVYCLFSVVHKQIVQPLCNGLTVP